MQNDLVICMMTSVYTKIEFDRGHIVFVLSVCLFVCLLSTLTFAITFEL